MSVDVLKPLFRSATDNNAGDLVLSAANRAELLEANANRLWRRVARECEAMADHAYSTGLTVSEETAALVDQALVIFGRDAVQAPPLAQQANEGAPPAGVSGQIEPNPIVLLSKAHAALSTVIKPATPEAVLLLIEERRRHSVWYAFGPLPIVRQMLGLAILSLLILLVVSLSAEINTENMAKTLLQLNGLTLLKVEIFLLSAASLGSCFQNLQQMNAYISTGTYDPKFQSTYWTRWVMGVISGVVLSQLVYELFVSMSGSSNPGAAPALIGQPVLALLGGYSVDVVHGILSHTVNAIGNFFRSPNAAPSEGNAAGVAASAAARERLTIASEVSEFRGALAGDMDPGEILRRFDDMIKRNIAAAK